MLTFAIGAIAQNYPENLNDVGFFAMPGPTPSEWPHRLDAGRGLHRQDHGASRGGEALPGLHREHEGLRRAERRQRRHRSISDQGLHAAGDVPPAVADLLPYFQKDGATAPALEFLSPIKGPALEQITVEVGSGIRSAGRRRRALRRGREEAGPAAWACPAGRTLAPSKLPRPGITGAGLDRVGGQPASWPSQAATETAAAANARRRTRSSQRLSELVLLAGRHHLRRPLPLPDRRIAVLQPDALDAVRLRTSSGSTISRSSSASRSCSRA